MPSNVSLATMIQSVRRRTNTENQTAFITDAEIVEHLNYGLRRVYGFLATARAQEFFRNTFSFNTVPNVVSYPLPADFFELTSVDIVLDGNTILSARPYMESERNTFRTFPGWDIYGQPVFYRLQAQNIGFIPVPNVAKQVVLNYYPAFTDLTLGAQTFDGANGWEEYAILHATSLCKRKGNEDFAFEMASMGKLEEEIRALAAKRDGGAPERVQDIANDDYDYREGPPWGFW